MRYVIDIDGTVCISQPGRYEEATPIIERIDKINLLYDEGNYIVYFTARGMNTYENVAEKAQLRWREITFNQLIQWGAKFHELHLGKPSGDIYVDDKAVNSNDFFNI